MGIGQYEGLPLLPSYSLVVKYILEEWNKLISLLNNHVSMAVRIKEQNNVQFRDYLQRRSQSRVISPHLIG